MSVLRGLGAVLAVLAPAFVGSAPPVVYAAQAGGPAPAVSAPASGARDLIGADRPGIADGSQTIGRGRLQLEVGFQREVQEDAATTERPSFLPALLRIGLTTHLEGRVETNAYEWIKVTQPDSTLDTTGWTPVSLGLKYQLVDASDWPSVGTIVRVTPASGSGEIGSGRLTADWRLAADLDLPHRLSLNPNAGIGWYEDDDGRGFTNALLALTLSYAPIDRIIPFVEVAYQSSVDADGRASLVLNGGLAYLVGRNIQLDVSYGGGMHGPAPRSFFALGISIRAGR